MRDKFEEIYFAICLICVVIVFAFMIIFSMYNGFEQTSQDESINAAVNQVSENEMSQAESDTKSNEKMADIQDLRQQYDKIVVLDPAYGGEASGIVVDTLAEKDITLRVAKYAGEMLEKNKIKVIYTREEDVSVAEEERVKLANEIGADWFVSIHASFAQDSSLYGVGARYNETYYLPGLTSADFSYLLLEKVAAGTNEKVAQLSADTETTVIRQAQIPMAYLEIGYLSNTQERKLLSREDYLQKIAAGICDGILEAYDLQQALKQEKEKVTDIVK